MSNSLILKITLENINNLVWRRIAVPEHTTYAQLHMIIQIAFEWNNEHLYGFSPAHKRNMMYTDLSHDADGFGEDATEFEIFPDLQQAPSSTPMTSGMSGVTRLGWRKRRPTSTRYPRF